MSKKVKYYLNYKGMIWDMFVTLLNLPLHIVIGIGGAFFHFFTQLQYDYLNNRHKIHKD